MTNGEFENHKWYSSGEECDKIRDEKCPSAVFITYIGKSPDVPKSYSRAYRCHDKCESGVPIFSFGYSIYQRII
jgi:hypothetical protein